MWGDNCCRDSLKVQKWDAKLFCRYLYNCKNKPGNVWGRRDQLWKHCSLRCLVHFDEPWCSTCGQYWICLAAWMVSHNATYCKLRLNSQLLYPKTPSKGPLLRYEGVLLKFINSHSEKSSFQSFTNGDDFAENHQLALFESSQSFTNQNDWKICRDSPTCIVWIFSKLHKSRWL